METAQTFLFPELFRKLTFFSSGGSESDRIRFICSVKPNGCHGIDIVPLSVSKSSNIAGEMKVLLNSLTIK